MKKYLLVIVLCLISTFIIYSNCNIENGDIYFMDESELLDLEGMARLEKLEDFKIIVKFKDNEDDRVIYTFNNDNTFNVEEIFYYNNYDSYLEFLNILSDIYYHSNNELLIKTKVYDLVGNYDTVLRDMNYDLFEIVEDTKN